MNIKQLKKELGISNKEIAEFFGMSYNAYANSSAKQRYETALCRLYECVLLGGKKNIRPASDAEKMNLVRFEIEHNCI